MQENKEHFTGTQIQRHGNNMNNEEKTLKKKEINTGTVKLFELPRILCRRAILKKHVCISN